MTAARLWLGCGLSLFALAACDHQLPGGSTPEDASLPSLDAAIADGAEADGAPTLVDASAPADSATVDGATADGATVDAATVDAALPDPCGGITCNQPPLATCANATTRRTYAANGTCASGVCGYAASDAPCNGSCTNGTCGGATIPSYPGVTPTSIESGAALGLRVAPDEAHVLVQRTEVTTGPRAFSAGSLAVVTVAAPGSARELTSAVDFTNGRPRADFGADGKGLFFVDVSGTTMQLTAAAADGSGAHVLASGVVQRAQVAGNRVVYMMNGPGSFGDREVWAAVLPAGTPVKLVALGAINYPTYTPNPTGSAVLMSDESGGGPRLIQTATAVSTPIGSGTALGNPTWSPDGAHLAYLVSGALHVVNADGTGDATLAAAVNSLAFSPDGARLAYGKVDALGHFGALTVRAFAGGADVVLTPPTTHTYGSIAFSPDGALLVLSTSDGALLTAPIVQAGAFVELTTLLNLSSGFALPTTFDIAPAHDRVAMLLKSRTVSVLTAGGGAAQKLSVPVDQTPFYEGVAAGPRLLAFTSTNGTHSGVPGSVVIFPGDGSGTPVPLPGGVLPAFTAAQLGRQSAYGWQGPDGGAGQVAEPFTWGWFGSEVLYETNRGNSAGFDVVAATDDGGTVGVIAPGAQVWAVRDGGVPSRVFFTRPAQPGVFMTTLPQTPGR